MTHKSMISALALLAGMTPAIASAAAFSTAYAPMMQGRNGASVEALFTIGETYTDGDYSYTPVGILDGIGGYRLDDNTVRFLVNHELSEGRGYSYTVDDGAGGTVALNGARVSYFDVDINTKHVVGAGQAYDRVYDRQGNLVTNVAQFGAQGGSGVALLDPSRTGFDRFCSSALFEAQSFGDNQGLRDRIYFTNEETSGGLVHAVDVANNEIWALPAMGRGGWENVTLIDTGRTDKVAFVLGDDRGGAPMYLYVGDKSNDPGASFTERNGLTGGQLYVWAAEDAAVLNPNDFGGTGASTPGKWVAIDAHRPDLAGTPGYDDLGYASQNKMDELTQTAGAFRFSRPEDVATNPDQPNQIVLASTGRVFNDNGPNRPGESVTADQWGVLYTVDVQFDADGKPTTGELGIMYDGNTDAARGLRSPDNLDWSGDGFVYVNEDRSTDWDAAIGVNSSDASIVRVSPETGLLLQIAEMDRTVLAGSTDSCAGQLGCWESSGVLDVSTLFDLPLGSLLVADVQAHGLRDGPIGGDSFLSQGGQLLLIDLTQVPEPATLGLSLLGFAGAGALMRRKRRA